MEYLTYHSERKIIITMFCHEWDSCGPLWCLWFNFIFLLKYSNTTLHFPCLNSLSLLHMAEEAQELQLHIIGMSLNSSFKNTKTTFNYHMKLFAYDKNIFLWLYCFITRFTWTLLSGYDYNLRNWWDRHKQSANK